jgi:hypothetical protein
MNVRALSLLCVAAACLIGSHGFAFDEPPKKEASKKEEPKKEENKTKYEAGTYTGTFTASNGAGDQEGELTINIEADGKFTGESFNKTANFKVNFKGTILKDNKSIAVFDLGGGQKSSCFGTVSKTASGGWTGTLVQRVGTTAIAFLEYEVNPKAK